MFAIPLHPRIMQFGEIPQGILHIPFSTIYMPAAYSNLYASTLSDSTFEWTGGFMRYILCAALFCSLLGAQDNAAVSPPSPPGNGMFYVNGIDYHFISGTNYTVVAVSYTHLR